MEMARVTSSNISSIGYDSNSKRLVVLFNDGSKYEYYNVPANVHKELMASESISGYAHKNIYEEYEYSKI
ncbi:MAG TPA: KTSC domain-containing protein [Fibrobacter sp.]|nr:KTSC domain-containing protein [Fibrobacter sp.]